jgi:hypothetical protein
VANTEDDETGSQAGIGRRISVGVVAVVLAAAVVFVPLEAFPHHIRGARSPSFVDNVVDNSVVLFAVRLAVLFAVVYVGASVVGLIAGGRWLSQLGPFKASDPVARLDLGTEDLETSLAVAVETIETLKQRLDASYGALSHANASSGNLLDRVDTIEEN